MIKVMFMTNSLNGGGAEKVLQTLLLNLNKNKYDITLYSMHREEIASLDYPDEINYKVVFDEYNGSNSLKKMLHKQLIKIKGKMFQLFPPELFYRLIIHEQYDVEVAFIEGESTKIISGSPNRDAKKYAWVHIDLMQNPWTDFLYKNEEDECRHYKKFDKILCVSESVKISFLQKYRDIDGEKVGVQYNPVDRDEIIKKSQTGYTKHNAKEKTKLRMVAVGRLVPQKGFDRLVKICKKLSEEGYSFELFIVGEGAERTKLEQMITDFNLNETVRLLGFLNNPYAVMTTADLMVCSSRTEGFSTVMTEGLILGLPIISTECAGVYELFGEKKCGRIVGNNSDSLYEALKEVLDCPNQLIYYRTEAMERGKDFILSKTIADIEKLLEA